MNASPPGAGTDRQFSENAVTWRVWDRWWLRAETDGPWLARVSLGVYFDIGGDLLATEPPRFRFGVTQFDHPTTHAMIAGAVERGESHAMLDYLRDAHADDPNANALCGQVAALVGTGELIARHRAAV